MEVDENSHVCSVCHESKDLSRARFAHVRLGLDDPPEPVLYKCKDSTSIINSIQDKIAKTEETQDWVTSTTMDSLADINVNAALIDSVSGKRVREVELRINTHLPKSMFKKMEQGLFAIRKNGCICWTGPETNTNVKVRKRSTGEAVLKVTRSRTTIAPGYLLAMSARSCTRSTMWT